MSESTRLRVRFSLRTLLILFAIVCLAIASYVYGTRLTNAERELQKLRNETGHLTITDRTKVHVIAVNTDEPNTWRWRMFIPQGHKYSWNISAENIPKDDVPKTAGNTALSNEPYSDRDNEVLVTANLRRVEGDNWRLSVDSKIGDSKDQMYGTSLLIPEEKMRWMEQGGSTDGRVAGSAHADVFEPKGPILLLQRRTCERQSDGIYRPSASPMPGFMIWLKEE